MKIFLTLLAALAISSSANAADIKLQNPPINEKTPNFIAVNSLAKQFNYLILKAVRSYWNGLIMSVPMWQDITMKTTCKAFKRWRVMKGLFG